MRKWDEINAIWEQVKDSPEKVKDLHYRDKELLAQSDELSPEVLKQLFIHHDYPKTLKLLFENRLARGRFFIEWLFQTENIYKVSLNNLRNIFYSGVFTKSELSKLYENFSLKWGFGRNEIELFTKSDIVADLDEELITKITHSAFKEVLKRRKSARNLFNPNQFIRDTINALMKNDEFNTFKIVSKLAEPPISKIYSTGGVKPEGQQLDDILKDLLSNVFTLTQEEFNALIRDPNLPDQLKDYLSKNPNYFAPDDILSDWY